MSEIALVTGAAGFLGSHLVQALLDAGRPVRALIRDTPLALEHSNLEYFSGDVQDASAMLAVLLSLPQPHAHDTLINILELLVTLGAGGSAP